MSTPIDIQPEDTLFSVKEVVRITAKYDLVIFGWRGLWTLLRHPKQFRGQRIRRVQFRRGA